jgi:hypothetical protein
MWTYETTFTMLAFLAEVAVAVVIYFELELNRRGHFLEKATEEAANRDRRDIYEEYVQLGHFGDDFEKRSEAFVKRMRNYPALRDACERQIALFNNLGIIVEPRYAMTQGLVKILLHAAVYIWIILKPHILERQANVGNWYAEPLIKFTYKCAKFLVAENRPLYLRGVNGEPLDIKLEYIKEVKRDLENRIFERCAGQYLK